MKNTILYTYAITLSLAISACGPAPSSTASPSASPSPSPTPTASATPLPTATPDQSTPTPTPTPTPNKKTFITNSTYSPGFGGSASAALTAADQACANDGNKPADNSTYKALLASSTRRACQSSSCASSGASENSGWILSPSTTYTRSDGTTEVGTTTSSAIFSFPLDNSFTDSMGVSVITGLESDWTTSTDNCTDWTNGASGNYVVGYGSGTSSSAIDMSLNSCAQSAKLICVEQ